MHIKCWENVSYGILDCESKHLQIKTSTFHIFTFQRLHDFNFLKNAYL